MLNSRDIGLLRPDVAANCRRFVDLCKAAGLNVLVHSTVRDDAYQAYLYEQGRTRPGGKVTNSPTPTYHWDKAGLAFDFCRNVRGQEFSSVKFFEDCAEIAVRMGFEWGGHWLSFIDRPHLQWSNHLNMKKLTSAEIRAGKRPPQMPLYEGGTEVSKQEFDDLSKRVFELEKRTSPQYMTLGDVPDWGRAAVSDAISRGILVGVSEDSLALSYDDVRSMVFDHRRESIGSANATG